MGRYPEEHYRERKNMPEVKRWLQTVLPIYNIREASAQQQRQDDIDFLGEKFEGEEVSFEAKIRYKIYPDILIETISNVTRRTPGWIYVSKADILVYVFHENDRVVRGYLISLPDLQKWWRKTGTHNDYDIRYGETHSSEKLLYKTKNRVIPERDIPSQYIIYHPEYGLMNPITDEIDSSYLR